MKKVWRVLRWLLVVPVLFQLFLWLLNGFGAPYRWLYGNKNVSSKEAREWQETRDEEVYEGYRNSPVHFLKPAFHKQSASYISVETVNYAAAFHMVSLSTAGRIINEGCYDVVDLATFPEEYGIDPDQHSGCDGEYWQRYIKRDYYQSGDAGEAMMPSTTSPLTIGQLISVQMKGASNSF